jgi:hypothetical protein
MCATAAACAALTSAMAISLGLLSQFLISSQSFSAASTMSQGMSAVEDEPNSQLLIS